MDYKKHYDILIERAKLRTYSKDDYIEKHHIIPRCLGGTDDPNNLVDLHAREHFVAHQLLVKIYPTIHGLIYALVKMSAGKGYHKGRVNNRLYDWIKRKNNILKSETKKNKPWTEARRRAYEFNPVTMSAESNEKRRQALLGRKTSTGNLGHKQTKDTQIKKLLSNPVTISVWLISPGGEEVLCTGINRFAKNVGINVAGIRSIIRDHNKTYKGWKFLRYSTKEERGT